MTTSVSASPPPAKTTPRRIMLVASGMSPQVLTETLYALLHQTPPFVPDEIHLVTTTIGRDKAVSALLADGTGFFYRFCHDYGFSPAAFGEERIHTIMDSQGQPLADIKTPEDNEAAADTISQLVRSLTLDDSSLHVSLAGGRKTMSYYTGYALSLYGRRQDQLSHVLVSEGYENCRDFYYPTPAPAMITTHGGKTLDTSQARVTLAHIPFIRLREDLPERFLQGQAGFSETIQRMAKLEEAKSLTIDLKQCTAVLSGVPFNLADRELELAFLLMFARDRLNTEEPAGLPIPTRDRPNRVTGQSYLRALCELTGVIYSEHWSKLKNQLIDADIKERTLNSLDDGCMRYSFYNQRRNELLGLFKAELGRALAECYLPQSVEGRGGDYWLALPADAITVCRGARSPLKEP